MSLSVGGDWSLELEHALLEADWDVLSIFAVNWTDYSGLVRFASKIRWLRCPFGPDSSRGLTDLVCLERLELTDYPKPSPDYRKLPALEWLEVPWDKKCSQNLAIPELKVLTLHRVGGSDLEWIPEASALQRLELRGGRLPSLSGLRKAAGLQTLVIFQLNHLVAIDDIQALTQLEVLELDAPKATMESVDWLASMPSLARAQIFATVERVDWTSLGAHPSLRSIAIVARFDEADVEIIRKIEAHGRKVIRFQRYPSKPPGFAIELD